MTICQFYQRGQCRYGTACKFEHTMASGGTNQTYTRPGADLKVNIYSAESIKNDLSTGKERPMWPLSSYGPAKYEPTIFSGLDESPEELRVKAVAAIKGGNMNEYINYESSKIANAEQVISNGASNSNQVYEQATKNDSSSALPGNTTSAFGATSAFNTTTSAFGAPATTSAFSKPAFSQPAFGQSGFGAAATTSAFGTKPSAFGQPSTSGGGAFSAFAGNGTSAFGATASNNPTPSSTSTTGFSSFAGSGTSAFGATASTAKPSVFGSSPAATNTGGSVFGQSSFGNTSSTNSVFGAKPTTSVFGAPSTTSAFGAPETKSAFAAFSNQGGTPTTTTTTTTSVFGAPASTSAFGAPETKSAFAAFNTQAATPATTSTSAFGTPASTSAFGAPAVKSAFGGTSNSVFGNTPPATASAFGQSSFGASSDNNSGSAFGTTPASAFSAFATTKPAAFGQPIASAFNTTPSSAFNSAPSSAFNTSAAPVQSAFGNLSQQQPSNAFGGGARATFASTPGLPSGPPPPPDFEKIKSEPTRYVPGSTMYDSVLPPDYMGKMPEHVLSAFKAVKFEWGKVPEWVPPIELR
ncbi:C3H1-type domain-containing protein [Mycena indigotica]|uniref:C3H1-type domain-containing protein n=1 Tax=Mycena indigotica TaxID=2126181 RepID=A0A8H6W976_9AGAR|nr:C3H1-type domain-containing protein [Mycena indigotica]KAF7306333.1 C3H1-type domain-containing protein [Mycena indigotica]